MQVILQREGGDKSTTAKHSDDRHYDFVSSMSIVVAMGQHYIVCPALVRGNGVAPSETTGDYCVQNIADSIIADSRLPQGEAGSTGQSSRWKRSGCLPFRLSSFVDALDVCVTNCGYISLPAVSVAENGFYFDARKKCIACYSCDLRISAVVVARHIESLYKDVNESALIGSVLAKLVTTIAASHNSECCCNSRAGNTGTQYVSRYSAHTALFYKFRNQFH